MVGFIAMKFVNSKYLIFFTFFSLSIHAEFSGNFKSYPLIEDLPQYKEVQEAWQNSLKIQSQDSIANNLKTEIAYEITATYEKPIPQAITSPNYRIIDLNTFVHNPTYDFQYYGTLVTQNLNRFNFSYTTYLGDFTIGRQPIAFGSAKSINPTDVIAPFNLNTLDKEDRVGVDAIILKTTLTPSILLELGTVMGKKLNSDTSAFYIRPKFLLEKNEINLMLMQFKKRDLFGFDLQRPFFDAGTWFEAAYVKEPKENGFNDFFRLTTGLDYKFKNTIYLAGEYHYNGDGTNLGKLRTEDFVFLHHHHYVILSSTYEITPLLISSLQTYFGFNDNSDFTLLKFDYNYTDNLYFTIGSYLGIGNSLNSEFGAMGKIYYSSLRYYF